MRKRVHLLAAVATLGLTATGAYTMPMSSGAVKPALDATNLVEQSAVFIVEGRRYCFYFDGWHGAGWYRCGFAWRRGLGWGGVYGWQGWEYGPAARRFGHRGGDFRFREGRGDRDFRGTTTRERTTIREGSTSRGDTTIRSRSRDGNFQEGRSGRGDSFRGERSEGRTGGSFSERRGGGEFRGNMQMNANPPAGGPGRSGGMQGGAQMKSGGGAPGGGAPGGGMSGGGPRGGGEGQNR